MQSRFMNVESIPGGGLILTDITFVQISEVLGLHVSLDGGGVGSVVAAVQTLPLAISPPHHF